jgi:hypothetical protein
MRMLIVLSVLACGAAAAVAQTDQWQAVSSREGGFRVLMPPDVKESVVAAGTDAKGPVITHTMSAGDTARNEYLVSWTPYRQSSAAVVPSSRAFDAARDALMRSKEGRITAETTSAGAGFESRTIAFIDGDHRQSKVRFTIAGGRFYQVMAAVGSEKDGPSLDRFLGSFTIDPNQPNR